MRLYLANEEATGDERAAAGEADLGEGRRGVLVLLTVLVGAVLVVLRGVLVVLLRG